MALEKIINSATAKLAALDADGADEVSAGRDALVRHIDALGDGERIDDSWLTASADDTIALSPTADDGRPLLLNGKAVTFWPKAGLTNALKQFRELVTRGEFDDQLGFPGQPTVTPKIEGEQTPRDPDNGSMSTGGGRTDDDEAKTRFTENLDDRLVDRS